MARQATRWRPEARPSRRVVALGVATVALAVVVALVQSSVAAAALRGLMVLALLPCAAIDIDRRIIPNRITGPGSVVAIAVGLALDPGGELTRVLSALVAGGFLLIASLIRPAGMGMGDVKLTGMMGLFLGRSVAVALFAALIASVLTGVALATRRGVHAARKTALPFGPYLAFGGVLAALVGDAIVRAYLNLHS
jgi:leader peptidase (prepilin peptidase)/N-methyltransferase